MSAWDKKLNHYELNCFAHGVRIQRIAFGLTQRELYSRAREFGTKRAISTLSSAETMPGVFSAYYDRENRNGVIRALGVSESLLIRIGAAYMDEFGCYPCSQHPRNSDCFAHRSHDDLLKINNAWRTGYWG